MPPLYSYNSQQDGIWRTLGLEAAEAGVGDVRGYIASRKGDLARAVGGRNYLEQFQQQRLAHQQRQFGDYGTQLAERGAPVTSGRRRGVNTGGVGGAYGRSRRTGPYVHQAFGSEGPNIGIHAAGRAAFKGAQVSDMGVLDPTSLSLQGREQLRNVAYQQFFDPTLSGRQVDSAQGAAKLASARGIRGKATASASSSMANRFKAGNRRAALDFILDDVRQSDASSGNVRRETETRNLLARGAAFNLLSRGRTQFQSAANYQRAGGAEGLAQTLLSGNMAKGDMSSILGDLTNASKYVSTLRPGNRMATGALPEFMTKLMQGGDPGDQLSGNTTGSKWEGFESGRAMYDRLTSTLQDELFSGTSGRSISDILAGGLDRDASRAAGYANSNIDRTGGNPNYRDLFASAFGMDDGRGAFNPMGSLQQSPRGGGYRGNMAGGTTMHTFGNWTSSLAKRAGYNTTPARTSSSSLGLSSVYNLSSGRGSEGAINSELDHYRAQLARTDPMKDAALRNEYNQKINILRESSGYLSDIRSNFLSPMRY